MALAEDLAAALLRDQRCKYVRIIDALPSDEQQAIAGAIEAGIPYYKLATILTDNGHSINQKTVLEHAKGTCRCPSPTT